MLRACLPLHLPIRPTNPLCRCTNETDPPCLPPTTHTTTNTRRSTTATTTPATTTRTPSALTWLAAQLPCLRILLLCREHLPPSKEDSHPFQRRSLPPLRKKTPPPSEEDPPLPKKTPPPSEEDPPLMGGDWATGFVKDTPSPLKTPHPYPIDAVWTMGGYWRRVHACRYPLWFPNHLQSVPISSCGWATSTRAVLKQNLSIKSTNYIKL